MDVPLDVRGHNITYGVSQLGIHYLALTSRKHQQTPNEKQPNSKKKKVGGGEGGTFSLKLSLPYKTKAEEVFQIRGDQKDMTSKSNK